MKTYSLDINGAALNIFEEGDGDLTLVFLHYWGGTSKTARQVIKHLSPSYRCIAFDQRGWGGSAKTGDFTLGAYAADTAALIGKLGLRRFVLVGHSMGGKIAQLLASERPDGLVGLVLIAPAPAAAAAAPVEQRQMMLDSYQTREGISMALTILTEQPLSAELREQVIEDSLGGTSEAKAAWPTRSMVQDLSLGAGSITVPTLVIVGDADKVEAEATLRHEIPKVIPQADFEILPGVGHLAPLEAPSEVVEAIERFLSSAKGIASRL